MDNHQSREEPGFDSGDNYWRFEHHEVSGSAVPLAQVVLLHVIAEGSEAHAEEFRGLHLDTSGALQRLRDVIALDLLHVCLEIEATGRQSVAPGAVAWDGSPSE